MGQTEACGLRAGIEDDAPARRRRGVVGDLTGEGMRVRIVPVVDLHRFAVGPQPVDRGFVRVGGGGEPARVTQQRVFTAQCDEGCNESDVGRGVVTIGHTPVQPGDGVVLAIRVVVAALAVAEFVAGAKHRSALRQQHGGEQRAAHATAGVDHQRMVAVAFDAEICADLVRMAVAIAFAIGEIVLVAITHHIGERAAVVRGDEVDAGRGQAMAVMEKIARRREPPREFAAADGGAVVRIVAQPIIACTVAEAIVPFEEAARHAPELITVVTQVPGLGDQMHLR